MFILFFSVLTIVIVGMGVTLAYLTKDTEKRANIFTFGNVSIELTEPDFDEEDKTIYPEKTIPKNPTIKNVGENDAYIYMEVKVPKANVRTYGENGSIIPAKIQELFTFDVNNGWEFVEELEENVENENVDDKNKYNVYLYVYNKSLSSGESTKQPLFDEVEVIPMLEGELDMGSDIEIPITAYAVQADFVESFEKSNYQKIFDKYILGKEGS